MSLQIWLPLNGDLHNQGLLGYFSDSTTQGATDPFSQDGKFGKCLCYNNNLSTMIGDSSNTKVISLFNTGKIFSVAFWFKLKGVGTSTQLFQIGNTTNGNYGLWWTNNTSGYGPRLVWNDGDGGKSTGIYVSMGYNTAIDYENWHHFVGIIDKTNQTVQTETFYLDGQFVSSDTYNNSSSNQLVISTDNNFIYLRPYYAMFNDVRIYDHALSAKEVEEISKGLVLHYKMDNIIQPNLLSGNPNLVNAWVQDGITLTQESDNSLKCVVTANNNKRIYNNVSNVWTTIGNTYTVSFLAKAQTNGTKVRASRSITDYAPTFTLTTDWKYYSAQITITATSTGGTLSIQGINNGDIFWLQNIKLEKGSIATYYLLPNNTLDTIYDSSGYGNNGTIVGSLETTIPSPRYGCATQFDDNTDSITISPYLVTGQTLNEITVSCWFKTNTLNSTAPNIFSLGENSFLRCRLANATSIWSYYRVVSTQKSSTYSCKNLLDSTWHLLNFTFLNGIEKVYLDGEQIGSTNQSSTGTYLTCASTSWHLAEYNASSENFIGALSDFRIYATALTAEQVADLYRTSMTIDNQGNIHVRELVE